MLNRTAPVKISVISSQLHRSSSSMESFFKGMILPLLLLPAIRLMGVDAKRPPFSPGPWKEAHTTFYGSPDGSGTMQGACGYGDLQEGGYGLETTSLSSSLWNNGAACGACFEIRCHGSPRWCKPGAPSIVVTATNSGAQDVFSDQTPDNFDLPQPAFLQIAEYEGGIVPVQYRRVPCKREGGITFTISSKSNPWFMLVLVSNVGGAGDVQSLSVKGSESQAWREMRRNWGQYWEINDNLVGQSLSFRVRASDRRTTTSWHVAPSNWQFGQTFQGKNFRE
ncbi:hypothetical protein Nepgr_011700 [Nepenthes gracilis]|uniref:Expansin n=1 Tax=Nepenthes gracilis TaxID=150966 RepID=A0AAD3SFS0_NEPGR|nr:hypothetical protein Nepgr_011700 [Nepenthes gracilis]